MVWIIVSIPLWVAGLFSLLLGVLTCLVGSGDIDGRPKLSVSQDIAQTRFGIVLTALGSGFFYAAAKLCGY
jgi:hypothetical protein